MIHAEDTRTIGGTDAPLATRSLSEYRFPPNPAPRAAATGLKPAMADETAGENAAPHMMPPLAPPSAPVLVARPAAARLAQRRGSAGDDGAGSDAGFDAELENPPNSPMSIAGSYMSGNSAASSRRPSITQMQAAAGARLAAAKPAAAPARSASNLGAPAVPAPAATANARDARRDEQSQYVNISDQVCAKLNVLMQGDESIFKGRRGSVASTLSSLG